MVKTILPILLILTVNAALLRLCAGDLNYTLPEAANVTIVVEDAEGRRVRNLVADAPREAGKNVEIWDGYDDAGEPCAAGEYCWRGLVHGKIESRYAGSFYSPGDPPWRTSQRERVWNISAIGSGGWLSDHRPPLCVAATGGDVFVGSEMSEAGNAMIRVDAATGRKTWGVQMIALIGASAFAKDGDTLFIAGEGGWCKGKLRIVRFNLEAGRFVPTPDIIARRRGEGDINKLRHGAFVEERIADFSGIRGMALTPSEIVLSLADKGGRIVCFSRETAEFTREIPLPGAGQLATAPDGAIWAVCSNGVANVENATATNDNCHDCSQITNTNSTRSTRSTRLNISAPLRLSVENPRGLAIDSAGNFYVSDVAASRQCVEVFSPGGSHLRTIGHSGGRREGKFDPMAMSNPVSLAVDAEGRLWVAENEIRPKRVSVWDAKTGELVRDYVGTPYYGGGGSLDAEGRFAYYDGMRFCLAPDFSGATLDAILYRPEDHPDVPFRGAPSTVRTWRGRTFLVSDSGCGSRHFIGEIAGDRLVPLVAVEGMASAGPAGKKKTVGAVLWQRGERTEIKGLRAATMWGSRIGPGMELVMRIPAADSDWKTDALAVLRPDENLRYDVSRMKRIEMPDALRGMVYSCAVAPDGRSVVVNAARSKNRGENVIAAVSMSDGQLLWTYPNPYPSNGHNSPLPHTGELRHTCGFEGWAGDVFQLNGNKGTRYLFTSDGLFVAELFGDQRLAPSQYSLCEVKRGDDISGYSLNGECFGGWLGECAGGRPFQIVGKSSLSICAVAGLGEVRRLSGGKTALVQPPPKKTSLPPSEQEPAVAMDCGEFGFQRGWQDAVARSFPEDKVAAAAFGVSRSGGGPGPLRLFVKVRDDSPWENGGGDLETMFKSGDCIDLRWAADAKADPKRRKPAPGDIRLLFAPDGEGDVTAVKYIFADPSVTPDERRSFTSPTGTAYVDRIEYPKIKASAVKTKDGYEFTADIPWKVLGESGKPAHGETRRADVGVLFGGADAAVTVRRVYMFDAASGIVDDLPSEVRVCPANWGSVAF